GELEVTVGDEAFILRPGDSLMAPRGIPHQLRNSGDVENHYLLVFSPPGFEEFLRLTAVPAPDNAAAPTRPPAIPVQNVHELAAGFGILFDADGAGKDGVSSLYNEETLMTVQTSPAAIRSAPLADQFSCKDDALINDWHVVGFSTDVAQGKLVPVRLLGR